MHAEADRRQFGLEAFIALILRQGSILQERRITKPFLILAACSSKSKEKRVLIAIQAILCDFLCVFMSVGVKRALSAIFFSTVKEEVVGQLAGDHNAGSSCVEPSLV